MLSKLIPQCWHEDLTSHSYCFLRFAHWKGVSRHTYRCSFCLSVICSPSVISSISALCWLRFHVDEGACSWAFELWSHCAMIICFPLLKYGVAVHRCNPVTTPPPLLLPILPLSSFISLHSWPFWETLRPSFLLRVLVVFCYRCWQPELLNDFQPVLCWFLH